MKKTLLKRSVLAAVLGTACALPISAETITAVMQSGLRVTDPIITTAHITRNHGYMIYDTLLAVNSKFEVQPQMASVEMSDDGLTYTFTLRDGLKWHDGKPVRPEDCIASLKRWMERDTGGQMIAGAMTGLEPTGDATFTLSFAKPFPSALSIIAKPSSLVPFMMPERVAATPSDQAITDLTGSGPFTFVAAEYQPNVKVVYEKFADYVPAPGEPDWLAGAKTVMVDRVEWVTMPDAMTTINALMSGEVDFLESPPTDLAPILEGNPEVTVGVMNTVGWQTMARMNFKYPPFDNVKIRQAAMTAMKQEDVLAALIGNPEFYHRCGSVFGCNTPFGFEDGGEVLKENGDTEAARKMLEEAGYDGTPVVLLQPTDIVSVNTQPVVIAQNLRDAGFNVDLQAMDWQTLVTRRASQKPPAEGGWNMMFTNWIVPEINSPLNNAMLNGRGDDGWFGWPENPAIEELRTAFLNEPDPEAQKEIARQIQAKAMEDVMYVPLGEYSTPWAWSNELSGVREAPLPLFWGVDKS